jgi:metal-responsive CopG/Arc/MetJ family transcriptional regulator
MRINTVIDKALLEKIDRAACAMSKSRSLFIREATDRYLSEIEAQKAEEERKRKFEAAARRQDDLREKAGEWDGVPEIRKGRERIR